MNRSRWFAMLAVVAVLASGCYYNAALTAQSNAAPVPWFCNPTNPNSVTGPGMGPTDFYAGITRAPLGYDDCNTVAAQFDVAKAYAEEYPTLGDAEANGFRPTFRRINGMGTHHGINWLTPADLADPAFDRFDPVVPNSAIDGKFNPGRPEFLQYDGNGPGAALVGMSYYVKTTTGQPPAGFVGDNDWWHVHPWMCLDTTDATVVGINQTDAVCHAPGDRINVYFGDYYMLHVWLVDDIELHNDVHSAFHPCIVTGGAIFDMDDPCHEESSLVIPNDALPGAAAATGDPVPQFCPLGLLAPEVEFTDPPGT